jgi:hypothetical protein
MRRRGTDAPRRGYRRTYEVQLHPEDTAASTGYSCTHEVPAPKRYSCNYEVQLHFRGSAAQTRYRYTYEVQLSL